jgi:uncharacterized protein
MKVKPLDPRRLDLAALAVDNARLVGEWPQAALVRLTDLCMDTDAPPAVVSWAAQGQARPVKAGEPEVWLHLQASTTVQLCCQRCLGPAAHELLVDRWLRFVADEVQAEALDADSDDDVLVLERFIDLVDLVEDEFLLGLPVVPRHEVCPQPLPLPKDPAGLPDAESAPHPFAALAALKKPGGA